MKKWEPYQRASVLVLTTFILLNLLGIAVRYIGIFARGGLGFTTLMQTVILVLPAFLYRRVFKVKKKIRHTTGYRRKSRLPFAIWATVLVASTVYLLQILPQYLIYLGGGFIASPAAADQSTPTAFFVLSILPVLFEEYLFRGTVFVDLTKNLSPGKAILLTSIYFALLHGDETNILAPFAAGILLGILVFLLGSVKYAVAAHLAANLLQAQLSYTVNESNITFFVVISLVVSLIALYFAASAAQPLIKYDILKENIDYFRERLETPIPFMKATLRLPPFLIFVALFIVRVVTGI
jgi:membrane protease YdiL (CAAX protease family)